MRLKRIETYLVFGGYLTVGLLLGYFAGKERPHLKLDAVTVDVVKEGDEILVYEHYTGEAGV